MITVTENMSSIQKKVTDWRAIERRRERERERERKGKKERERERERERRSE